ncbi:MAG TPA: hypothetical protein PKZ99_05370, partial [Azospirillaceae bacterium]|nr:hypothetical protein [Azospirillaceae bacterium]
LHPLPRGERDIGAAFVVFQTRVCDKSDKTHDKTGPFVWFCCAAQISGEAPACPKDVRAVQQSVGVKGFRMRSYGLFVRCG